MTDELVSTEPQPWSIIQEPYGWELQLDLYDCDRAKMSEIGLRVFVIGDEHDGGTEPGLVKRIGMVAYGDFECPHFGHTSPKTAGFSFKQWIETSLISGHEANGNLYLNVFSCVAFEPDEVIRFAMDFFSAGTYRQRWTTRY